MEKSSVVREVFGFTKGDSNSELPSPTPEQTQNINNILNLLDEADPYYDSKDTKHYAAAFAKARKLHEQSNDLFVARDLRLNLLDSIMAAYKDVGVLLLGADLDRYHGSPDPTALAARMRKVFLRQMIENNLDTDGQGFLNYLLGR